MTDASTFFSLPVGANPNRDQRIGVDELGRAVYRAGNGQEYAIGETFAPDRRYESDPGTFARVRDVVGNMVRGGIDAFTSGVTAPARAARGEPVTYGDAFETAGMAQLGGAAMPAPRGALRIFAGRNAQTADLDALTRAQRLAAEGADRGAIWNDTGWFQGVDGQWRFEIDDSASALGAELQDYGWSGALDEALPHESLAAAYPDIADIDTRVNWTTGSSGSYTPSESRGHLGLFDLTEEINASALREDGARSVLLHELQHAVQQRERFATGTNPQGLRRMDDLAPDEAFARYRTYAGEVEARNVQTRADFTPDQRRATPPWETMDVPEAVQIVRFGGGAQASTRETPAAQVARLLREGRASEITDDLMAQADPQEMYRLYEAGETGMPMPMDDASRMQRAGEMGFDTREQLYHGTGRDFAAIDPYRMRAGEGGEGFFTTDDPYTASSYADQGSDWGAGQVQPLLGRNDSHVYADFEGARWDQFAPEIDSSRWGASGNSWNDYDPFGWQDLDPEDWAGEYYTTNDIARVAREDGYSGARFYDVIDHVSPDELDPSNVRVDFDPRNIRSRFARFDPRLSHLANLNAANASPLTGIMSAQAGNRDEEVQRLAAYLAANGGLN